MIGTIRRHQQWIWLPIVVITIISFVYFFKPSGSGSDREGGSRVAIINGKPATINGKPIPLDEFRSAQAEARLFHFFRSNGKDWPENDETLERDTVIRVFLIHKLKDLGIQVSDMAVGRLAQERLGTYPLASLEKEHLLPHGLTLVDFDRFMHHEAAIQQLVGVVTTSAKLIQPQEAEILFRKEHEETAAEIAVFWASNYVDKVTATPAGLTNYFLTHQPNYRVPERVQVNYVEFAASNYVAEAEKQLAEITNLTARVDEFYYKQGTNTFKDTNGMVLPEAAAKAKIRQEIQHERAMVIAHRKASEFGGALSEQPQPERADNLEKLAPAKGFTVQVSPPLDAVNTLENTNFSQEFRERALKLTKDNPILFNPIAGEDGFYLISLKNRLPSEMPPLEKVQDKVTADYKNFQAWELARTDGTNFSASVTNGLAQKKAFKEICEQTKVKPLVLPTFSPSTSSLTNLDERINFYMVRQVAFSLKPGEASPFYPLPRQEGGLLLYVRAKVPVDETKVKAELPEYMGRLRMYRQNEDFNQWFTRQAELAKVVIPRKEAIGGMPGS